MTTSIHNPILRGFHPDPSMIYVDGVYYIATSTFEWFPGVSIYQSTDLLNWDCISRPLNSIELLDMKGNPGSAGVWAPCLSYDKGLFYLVFSNVRSWKDDPFKDVSNYITTCSTIDGEWSKPIYVNSSGFDPSLFHDEDGKKWFVNMEWDHRVRGVNCFSGILIQEWDEGKEQLVGPVRKIFKGTKRGLVEGPHIYKRNGYYYLFCAEGGTDTDHAESVARSKDILGPYEIHPKELILTSLGSNSRLRKAGHGSICHDDKGQYYMAHLCSRYLDNIDRSPLGRETAIQRLIWEDDWPYLEDKTTYPKEHVLVEGNHHYKKPQDKKYTFDNEDFLKDFMTLRIPYSKDIFTIDDCPGYLRISGKESPYSTFTQALLARRQEDFNFNVETTLSFDPRSFMHMAGLSYRYNERNQYFLYISYDEMLDQKILQMLSIDNGVYQYLDQPVVIDKAKDLILGLDVVQDTGQFYYVKDNEKIEIGEKIHTSILSDEYASPMGFTGAFIGMLVVDLKNHQKEAYFKNFNYLGNDHL